jgi:16S rRNA (uracil1498-N3)-methyltransferase
MTRRFFISPNDITGDTATLTGQDAKHLKSVLRLAPGDPVILVDGKDTEYKGIIRSIESDKVDVAIRGKKISDAESPVQIVVGQALLKDKKMDGLIRQLTELGISHWIPFTATRSIPRPPKKRIDSRLDRWRKISAEALKQCRRGRTVEIASPMNFEDMLDQSTDCDLKLIFWEQATVSLENLKSSETQPSPHKIMVIFGPEGGFTQQEVQSANTAGFVTASLGPRILKAETATIAGSTLLQFLFGDMS